MAIPYQNASKIYYRAYRLFQGLELEKINIDSVCVPSYLNSVKMILPWGEECSVCLQNIISGTVSYPNFIHL